MPIMLNQLFTNTASALCYSIIQHCCQPTLSLQDFPHNDVVRFVLQQHQRMPDYLRFPIVFLTVIFDVWGVIVNGSLFHHQSHTMRWQQILAWKTARFSLSRDLIRFYESLVVLAWKSEQMNSPKSN